MNWTRSDGEYTQRKKAALALSRDIDGPSVHTTASTVLGGSGIQERTSSPKDRL